MLKIRLARTGRKNYPSYRIVVAEHSAAVKGKFIDIVGHYIPTRDPKVFEYDAEKIKEWIAKGAKPSDTVATLLKNAGMTGMDKYIEPRNKKRKKKKEQKEATQGAVASEGAPAEAAGEEAPAAEVPAKKTEEAPPAEQTPEPAVDEAAAKEDKDVPKNTSEEKPAKQEVAEEPKSTPEENPADTEEAKKQDNNEEAKA